MPTYQELKSKAGEILKQAEKIRKKEVRTIIAEIRAMMAAYDLTVDDLQPKARRTRAAKATAKTASTRGRKPKATAKPKYRNPETGATWTGRGKPPNWIKDAKNRDAFLISQG
jgi:DNA-binding protein H-NS